MAFYEDLSESIVNELYGGDQMYNNIYNIVLAKKWTMETLLKIATLANVDIDTSDGELHVLPNGVVNNVEVDNKYNGGDTVGYHQYLYSALGITTAPAAVSPPRMKTATSNSLFKTMQMQICTTTSLISLTIKLV